MTTLNKQRLILAIGAPAFIFAACTLITFSKVFKQHSNQISVGILFDLLLVAPLLYYVIIRKSTISKQSVSRVFMVGLLVATTILSKNNSALLEFIKTWVAPLIEIFVVSFIVFKFYKAKQLSKHTRQATPDFLIHCRSILAAAFGNETMGNVVASEVSVFYYLFGKKAKHIDYKTHFTSYKENGILAVLYTLLFIFLLETVVMHFAFGLWNETLAWVLSGLSIYTCLQLWAHIRATTSRPIVITDTHLIIRNGLLGGDAIIDIDTIDRIEISTKEVTEAYINMAFIKGIENHNTIIYLKREILVTKAFGIKKPAKIILANIDEAQKFMNAIHSKNYSLDL